MLNKIITTIALFLSITVFLSSVCFVSGENLKNNAYDYKITTSTANEKESLLIDELGDFSKIYTKSANWTTNEGGFPDVTTITTTKNSKEYIVYKADNISDFTLHLYCVPNGDYHNDEVNVYVSNDGTVWEQIEVAESGIADVENVEWNAWKQNTLFNAYKLPDNTQFIKFEVELIRDGSGVILNDNEAWRHMIAKIELFAQRQNVITSLVDDFYDESKIFSKTCDLYFTETNTVFKNSLKSEYIIYYLPNLNMFELTVNIVEFDYYGSIQISSDGLNWKNITYSKSAPLETGNWAWKKTVITPDEAIPQNINYIKFELTNVYINGVEAENEQWRMQYDKVVLKSVEPEKIHISNPKRYQVIQRENGSADVTVDGVFLPNKDVDITLTEKNNSTKISETVQTEENGYFSYIFLDLPQGIYDILVSSEGKKAIVTDFGVGDVWLISGQSNAAGYAVHLSADEERDAPAQGVNVYYPDTFAWEQAKEPYGQYHATSDNNYGFGLEFGKKLMEKTGVPIGIIQTAVGGTPLSEWNPDEGGYLYRYYLASCFIENAPKITGMIWYQGEAETVDENAKNTYAERFCQMITAVRKKFGNEKLPIITCQLNSVVQSDPTMWVYWEDMKEIQRRIADHRYDESINDVYIVSTNGLQMSDGIHNGVEGNKILASRLATMAYSIITGNGEYKQPNIQLIEKLSNNKLLLTFENVTGGFKASNIITDFKVRDNNGEVEINNVSIIETNKVEITTKAQMIGNVYVDGLGGCMPIPTLVNSRNEPILTFTDYQAVILGDVNNDGKTDVLDLVRIKKFIAGQKVTMLRDAADVSLDSTINSEDLVILRKYLLQSH